MSLLDRHLGLVASLREAGVPVAVSEDLDALAAVRAVDWDRRATLREAYAACLVKRTAHRAAFDALFDLWFPPRTGDPAPAPGADGAPGVDGAPGADGADAGVPDDGAALADLRRRLADAMAAGESTEALAVAAVGAFGRLAGRPDGASTWSAYTTLRRVAPDDLAPDGVGGGVDGDGPVAAFRREVEADALRRIAEQKGPAHVARSAVRPPVDRLAFTAAGARDLAAIRREVAPLARRLAARLAHDHRVGRRGRPDVRRTVRAALGTGGVPFDLRRRPRRERRTDLVVLCDVSGSVAHFARFTLLLVLALREQFRGVRAFAFVDDVAEVTDLLRPGVDVAELLAVAADGASASGRTDYGRALRTFAARHPDAVGPRTTLLVLGDARSNYGDPGADVLRRLAREARRTWWLNPEPARQWDTGDSAASRYDVPMAECRDLAQLGAFVRDHL